MWSIFYLFTESTIAHVLRTYVYFVCVRERANPRYDAESLVRSKSWSGGGSGDS